MRRRWPGSSTPRRVRPSSVRARQSHTDHRSLCWKFSTYWSRWRADSQAATGRDPSSSMAGGWPQKPAPLSASSAASKAQDDIRTWKWRHRDQSPNTNQVKPGVPKSTFPVKHPGFPMASNHTVSTGSPSPWGLLGNAGGSQFRQ